MHQRLVRSAGSARPARAPCRAGTGTARGRPSRVEEAQPRGQRARHAHGPPAGDDEAPLAEARHVRVVRRGRAGRRPRSSSPRSRSSRARTAARWSAPAKPPAARCWSTQLGRSWSCRACRARSWSDRGSRRRWRRIRRSASSQAKASALTIVSLRRRSAPSLSAASSGIVAEQPVICGSRSTSVTLLDARVLEHLAHRQAVAAAEHQHASAAAVRGQRRDAPAPRGSGTRRASGTAGCR